MGQIFNRVKRLVRAKLKPWTDAISGTISDNDFLRKKWEESEKFRENLGDKFDKGQENLKDAWDNLTATVPGSLKDSYEVLGVPFGLPFEDVKKAWKSMMMKHHPDRFTNPKKREAATKKTAELNEAYQKIEKFFKEGRV